MKHCCKEMEDRVNHKCDQHPDPFDCADYIVSYYDKFNEYGIVVHDGGTAVIVIKFCPWCGTALPPSTRGL